MKRSIRSLAFEGMKMKRSICSSTIDDMLLIEAANIISLTIVCIHIIFTSPIDRDNKKEKASKKITILCLFCQTLPIN